MRGYKSYPSYRPDQSMPDRIFSGLSCLTYGLTGFLWLIVSHIKGQSLSSFARFHVFQSIFVFIGVYVIGLILNIFLGFVQIMPFIGPVVANLVYYVSGYPVIFGLPAVTFLVQALAVYMAAFAFWGKYAEVPGVSDSVRRMI